MVDKLELKGFSLIKVISTPLWIRWVIASGGSWALTGLMGRDIVATVSSIVSDPLVPAISRIIVGALIGIVQWLILRRFVARAGWWILACSTGWVFGGMIGEKSFRIIYSILGETQMKFLGLPLSALVSAIVGWALNGATVGGIQWFVLRQKIKKIRVWVLACSFGWALGGIIGEIISEIGGLSWALEAGIIGTIGAIVTGYILVIMLIEPKAVSVGFTIPGRVISAIIALTIFAGAEAGVFAARYFKPEIMLFMAGNLDFVFLLTIIAALSLGWSNGGATGLFIAGEAPISRLHMYLSITVSYGICVLTVGGLWGLLPGIAEIPQEPVSLFLEVLISIFDVQPLALMLDLENLSMASGILGAIGGIVIGLLFGTAFVINLRRETNKMKSRVSEINTISKPKAVRSPSPMSFEQLWAEYPQENILVILAWLDYLLGARNPKQARFLPLRGAIVVKKKRVLVGISTLVEFVRLFGIPKSSGLKLSGAYPAWYFGKFGITAIFNNEGTCRMFSVRCAQPTEDDNCFSGKVIIPPHHNLPSHSRVGLDPGVIAQVLETIEMPERLLSKEPYGITWSYTIERKDWEDTFKLEFLFSPETNETISISCIM